MSHTLCLDRCNALLQACCSMLGRQWAWFTKQASSRAIRRLLEARPMPASTWGRQTPLRDNPIMDLITEFNTGQLFERGGCLVNHPAVLKAVRTLGVTLQCGLLACLQHCQLLGQTCSINRKCRLLVWPLNNVPSNPACCIYR